ncbi:Hypothetical predicted protein, partial [Marmota monax]
MSSWFRGLGSSLGQSLGQVGDSLASLTSHKSKVPEDEVLDDFEDVKAGLPSYWRKNIEDTKWMIRYDNERLKNYCADLEE